MIRPKRIRFREVMSSPHWKIISVIDHDKKYRVEAVREEPIKDHINHFVGYGGRQYLEQMAQEYYGKHIMCLVEC